jgi:YidC/Oxa1 family membrane protein insertase
MDRNQVIGFLLIGAILVGFSIFNQPTPEELAALKHQRDSIENVEKALSQQKVKQQEISATVAAVNDSLLGDSAISSRDEALYGAFSAAANGENAVTTMENEVFKVHISNKGGRIKSVELKKYKTFYGTPVTLFEGDSTRFSLNFFSQNKTISTADLYFRPIGKSAVVKEGQAASLTMRLEASPGQYIDYIYTIKGNSYLLDYNISFVGINNLVAANTGYMELDWMQHLKNQEREAKNERLYSTIYYQYDDGENEVDYITETTDEKEELKTKVKWVAMKQHFFTQVLIADKSFESPTTIETSGSEQTDEKIVKTTKASFTIPYGHGANETVAMHFYFGPNHYQILQKTGFNLHKQIPMGWGILGWVNKFIVIPIFNWLDSFSLNYGIIILILTIVIKIILLPLTYKAYLSQAKMKVLKPEIEEIQSKNKEEPMKLQQEMMALYRKAGVSPLGGCWPMLLQLPILFALLKFFPSSIELRQQGFLWAHDLSTYDSILDLPFTIPFYGAHVSLFTLLMTASTLLLTAMNSQSAATNPQMKWMMYLMPVFFMGFLNSFSAGLNYYYFLANMISIGQQYLFRSFVDEDAIHRQIQENKKKPVQKSNFQKRLEDMAKQRGYKAPK